MKRLARPHGSGGVVVERAAIPAERSDSASLTAWLAQRNHGQPEASVAAVSTRGLHGQQLERSSGRSGGAGRVPDDRPTRRLMVFSLNEATGGHVGCPPVGVAFAPHEPDNAGDQRRGAEGARLPRGSVLRIGEWPFGLGAVSSECHHALGVDCESLSAHGVSERDSARRLSR